MPGMQSNSASDSHGPNTASIGPLEAAKSYRDSQRAIEAPLAAAEEEESDGRPAWLRRWPSEVRREIATQRYEAERGPGIDSSDESLSSTGIATSGFAAAEAPHYAEFSNGYSGQSIEAAFSFETVYRFETEFEAEATEDWLHLSEDGAKDSRERAATAMRAASPAAPSTKQGAEDEGGEFDPISDEVTASAARVDPQAVRAAIFRLAQESSAGLPRGISLRSTGFAETAARDEAEPDLHGVTHDLLQQPETDSAFLVAAAISSSKEAVFFPPIEASIVTHDADTLPTTKGMGVALAHEEAAPTRMSSDEAGRAVEVSSVASVDEPEVPVNAGLSLGMQSARRDGWGRVGEGPALAHDAGNLLSALNLYSELLALSGVLQARHQHYAQDLKLLAARSEVLISRLLAICKVAGEIHEYASNPPATADLETFARAAMQKGPGTGEELEESFGATRRSNPDTSPKLQAVEAAWGEAPVQQTDGAAAGFAQPLAGSLQAREIAEEEEKQSAISSPGGISRPMKEEAAPLNMVDLLTRWQSLLSMIARGSVEVSFGPNAALPIRVKEEVMERILVNLVHNSMTATRNGGAIRIGVGRVEKRRSTASLPSTDGRAQLGNRMVLTVDDSGCGMTEEQVAWILSRSPQGDSNGVSDATDRPGRGLGLQIVRELIATSGGRLAIYSRCGAGTRIEMQWPVVQENMGSPRLSPASVGCGGEAYRTRLTLGHSPGQVLEAGVFPAYPSRQKIDLEANGVEGAIAC